MGLPRSNAPNAPAHADLISEAYPAIRRLAAQRLIARNAGRTADATSLANQAVCRLLNMSQTPRDAEHVKALAAQALNWIIIDRQRAQIGSRNRDHSFEAERMRRDSEEAALASHDALRQGAIARALNELEARDPRKAYVFTRSTVFGVPFVHIAAELGIDERTARRDFAFAQAFLAARASGDDEAHACEKQPSPPDTRAASPDDPPAGPETR
ncbi:MAG: ECF-type sigma factor [Planctomycetota bacterium]|nr:ECF-type sigma factor [Planctomycetota bacterium]